jgi:hypothetical protein
MEESNLLLTNIKMKIYKGKEVQLDLKLTL